MLGSRQKRTHLPRIIEKHVTGSGESQCAAPVSVEQLNAKIFFKRLDLKAHRGLREIQLFRGLAEAELLRNCPENDETEILKARHSID